METTMAGEYAYINGYNKGFEDGKNSVIEEGFETYRSEAIDAATELRYKPEFLKRICKATTINEITRIMASARKDKFNS